MIFVNVIFYKKKLTKQDEKYANELFSDRASLSTAVLYCNTLYARINQIKRLKDIMAPTGNCKRIESVKEPLV